MAYRDFNPSNMLEDIPVQDLNYVPQDMPEDVSQWHQFRSASEFVNENKGGYIEGKIKVPQGVRKIKISLVTPGGQPHVNLLYVSPREKMDSKLEKIYPEDQAVTMTKTNGKWEIKPPKYWENLNSGRILGCNFWSENKSELILGKNGLQLTICKAVQKGISKICPSVKEMENYLGIHRFDGEISKARLKIAFDNTESIYFSKVIFDKSEYQLKIKLIDPKKICNFGDHIINIYFNKSVTITQEKSLKLLMLYNLAEQNGFEDYEQEVFEDYEIMSKNAVRFKVNAKNHESFRENVHIIVLVDDEHMDDNSKYGQFDRNAYLQIKAHKKVEGLDCYCERADLSTFEKTVSKSRKRRNPEPLQNIISMNSFTIHPNIGTDGLLATGDSPQWFEDKLKLISKIGDSPRQLGNRSEDNSSIIEPRWISFVREYWVDILLAAISIVLAVNCNLKEMLTEVVCGGVILILYIVSRFQNQDENRNENINEAPNELVPENNEEPEEEVIEQSDYSDYENIDSD